MGLPPYYVYTTLNDVSINKCACNRINGQTIILDLFTSSFALPLRQPSPINTTNTFTVSPLGSHWAEVKNIHQFPNRVSGLKSAFFVLPIFIVCVRLWCPEIKHARTCDYSSRIDQDERHRESAKTCGAKTRTSFAMQLDWILMAIQMLSNRKYNHGNWLKIEHFAKVEKSWLLPNHINGEVSGGRRRRLNSCFSSNYISDFENRK